MLELVHFQNSGNFWWSTNDGAKEIIGDLTTCRLKYWDGAVNERQNLHSWKFSETVYGYSNRMENSEHFMRSEYVLDVLQDAEWQRNMWLLQTRLLIPWWWQVDRCMNTERKRDWSLSPLSWIHISTPLQSFDEVHVVCYCGLEKVGKDMISPCSTLRLRRPQTTKS